MDAGAESVALCFQCGTCTGACPSGRRTPYRIRQVVRKSVMGLKDEVISDDTIWMCATCYECQERCPRGIKIVDVVKTVRNFAAQAGYMAPAHKATGSFVIKTGHGVPINDKTMALRKSVGLGELPPTTHQFPEALEEVQKIFKATGFDNLIGWNCRDLALPGVSVTLDVVPLVDAAGFALRFTAQGLAGGRQTDLGIWRRAARKATCAGSGTRSMHGNPKTYKLGDPRKPEMNLGVDPSAAPAIEWKSKAGIPFIRNSRCAAWRGGELRSRRKYARRGSVTVGPPNAVTRESAPR